MSRSPELALSLCALLLALIPSGAVRADSAPVDILQSGRKLYSQHDEELIIRHFFDDRRGGFFVDVGAWYWKNKSNTFYLEKHLGWSGIAIDALPEVAEGYEKNRPRTKFFQFIVTDHSDTTERLYGAGELSSTKKDHIDLFPTAKRRLKHKFGGKIPLFRVPTITLNELLDQNEVEKIDFLSMDIEQGEPAALAGFDIRRFRPALVCIEAGASVRDRIAAYFDENGYKRIEAYRKYDTVNWYYRPRSDESATNAESATAE